MVGEEGGLQFYSHSRIIIFPLGVKKCRLHEDQVGFPRRLIGNDADGEMAIQERPSFFGSCITIVVGVAILIAMIKGAGIAVAVAVAIPGCVGIAITVTFHRITGVRFDSVHGSSAPLSTGDRCIVGGHV